MRRALSRYLEERGAGTSDRVFLGQRGPLTSKGVQDLVRKLAYQARLEDVTPHLLRYTFAKTALDSGADLVKVVERAPV